MPKRNFVWEIYSWNSKQNMRVAPRTSPCNHPPKPVNWMAMCFRFSTCGRKNWWRKFRVFQIAEHLGRRSSTSWCIGADWISFSTPLKDTTFQQVVIFTCVMLPSFSISKKNCIANLWGGELSRSRNYILWCTRLTTPNHHSYLETTVTTSVVARKHYSLVGNPSYFRTLTATSG